MKKSWKKALLAGLSIVMMGSFIAGCGSENNGAANKDVLKVGVTNFASSLDPTENFFSWVVMRYGVGAPQDPRQAGPADGHAPQEHPHQRHRQGHRY